MNPASTSFVLGYHGCDRDVAENVLSGSQSLQASHNDYDWLADGTYFWEHNAQRAYEFACEISIRKRNLRQRIKYPAVLGAVIDLGVCLNLLDSRYIAFVRNAYDDLLIATTQAQNQLRPNVGGNDLLLRYLDCSVIRLLHATRESEGTAPFDTVRGVFLEGGPLYENAGFATKSHIQICVRNSACIKGYFRPIDESGRPLVFA